jgi:hypothetical protein
MIGATRRYLVSKTTRTVGDERRASCNVESMMRMLLA